MSNQAVYLAMFVLFGVAIFLVPIVYVRRYRYFDLRFRGTVYQRRFQVGWPLMTVEAEMFCLGCAIFFVWLLSWPPLGQDQWLAFSLAIFSPGLLCFLVGMSLVQDGLVFLGVSSSHRQQRQHGLYDN